MRSKKALYNVITSFALQIVTMICGFIVPRLIIGTYGSTVNGTINSITQFLSFIVLLEGGVGGVVKAALYSPLSKNDTHAISSIVNATERFFRTVAVIFTVYLVFLACVFPLLVSDEFGWVYTFTLVLIVGASTAVQYFFGITYQVLVQADQRRYITSNLQIATVILNAVIIIVMIKLGFSIHAVKLGSSVVYILRPLFLYFYMRKRYGIDGKAEPDNSAIGQRWDGLGHHIAYFLHTNTDVAVLTVFARISDTANMAEVSVYGVYYSVVSGVEKLTSTISSGIEAAFGNMIANKEDEALNRNFGIFEFISFIITTAAFTAAGILIVPFVRIYTAGITDADYIRPVFAYILTLAEAVYCIRIPYNSVTLAAGHYRQTRNGAFAEAGINIVLSAVLVFFWGITGVAAATLAAMVFRTVQYVMYLSKNILGRSIMLFVKRSFVNILAAAVCIAILPLIPDSYVVSYFTWAVYAVIILSICAAVVLTVNVMFFRGDLKSLLMLIKNTIKK